MKSENPKKRKVIAIILIIVAIIAIAGFTIRNSYAENTGGTARDRMDENTFVRMAATTTKLKSSANEIDTDGLRTEMESSVGTNVVTVEDKSSEIILVTFLKTGNQYEVNKISGLGGGYNPEEVPIIPGGSEEELPSTDYTKPYLPTGFTRVTGTDLGNGLTIQDNLGNQYVWVEVPKTTTVYPTAGLSLDLNNLTGTALTDAYDAIETDLHTYTNTYRNGTSYTDTYYSDAQTGLTSTQYTELKQKMLKSVYQNGGFYVGKYETGIENSYRTAAGNVTETPVIKQNAYPYNYVTCSQAQKLAGDMQSGQYTSSLMFGVQWDLVLRYLESKGATQSELKSNSTSWGNYNNNLWNIDNASSKYYTSSTSWTDGAYGEKTSNNSILLSTGASDTFSKQGIYDLAGNVFEWTLEYTSSTSSPCAVRGGSYHDNGYGPASYRYYYSTASCYNDVGFRVTLY